MNRAEESRQIARGAGSTWLARGVLVLSVLVLTPYLFRRLGPEGFGTWSVMFVLVTVFSLLEVGFSAGATKRVAQLRGESDRRLLTETVGTSVTLMAGLGTLALALAVLASVTLDGLAADSFRGDFRAGLVALGLALLVRFPGMAYGAALLGYQRTDLFSLGEAAGAVAFAAGAVVAIELGAGVTGVAAAYGLGLITGAVLFAVSLRRVDPGLSVLPRRGSRATRRSLASFGSMTLLASGADFVGVRMDTIVIAAVRNAATAAPYAAALKLQSGVQALTYPLYLLFMPMISELWAAGHRAEVARRLQLATRVVLQLALPVAVGVALFSVDITDLWLGADAPAVTAEIIAVLMAVQVASLLALPAQKVLIGIGRVRFVAGLATFESLANLGISIALVSAYGAIGAALGTLLTSAVLAPVRLPVAARAVGDRATALLMRSVLPALAASAPGVAMMGLCWALLEPGALRAGAGLGAGLGLCAAVALWQIGGPRRLRAQLGLGRPDAKSPAAKPALATSEAANVNAVR